MNRHELPAMSPECVPVDHRPLQRIKDGDLAQYLHATWDVTPDISFYIEAVHRLSNLGASSPEWQLEPLKKALMPSGDRSTS